MFSHVKGQRAFHADVSLYEVHAVVDNVGGRHVKDKAYTLSPVPLHNRQHRRKHLHTVGSLGLHAPALDTDLALFQDDVFLSEIVHIRDCQPGKAGENEQITDNTVVFPFYLQVDDALQLVLCDASRLSFRTFIAVAQERIEVQYASLHRHADDDLQGGQGPLYAATFQSAFNGEIIL